MMIILIYMSFLDQFIVSTVYGRKREYAVKVSLIIHNKEVMTYQHHPKYQELELFSYIGGYLGIWLGISLANTLDIIINCSMKVKNIFLYLKVLSSNTILPFQQAVATTDVNEK